MGDPALRSLLVGQSSARACWTCSRLCRLHRRSLGPQPRKRGHLVNTRNERASCPSQARCPKVKQIVIHEPKIGTGEAAYGPSVRTRHLSSATGPRRTSFHAGYTCGIRANDPVVSGWASGQGENHCTSGQGVTWMEMWTNINRWKQGRAAVVHPRQLLRERTAAEPLSVLHGELRLLSPPDDSTVSNIRNWLLSCPRHWLSRYTPIVLGLSALCLIGRD